MIKKLFNLTLLLNCCVIVFSQSVGINDDGSVPAAGAILDIKSTSKGLLIPRLTEAQRDAISPDVQSMLIYQTNNDSGFYFYDGSNWMPFLISGAAANSGWSTKGNAGTTPGTNFIGTTDTQDWVVKTDDTERMRIKSDGNVGIGTDNPVMPFEVSGGVVLVRNPNETAGEEAIISFNTEAHGTAFSDNNRIASVNARIIDGAPNPLKGALFFRVNKGDNTDIAMYIDENLNTGIGTTSPTHRLSVATGSDADVVISMTDDVDNSQEKGGILGVMHYTNAEEQIALIGANSNATTNAISIGGGYAKTNSATSIQFYTAANNTSTTGAERMIITSDGNLGIGDSSPSEKLDLTGNMNATGTYKLDDVNVIYQSGVDVYGNFRVLSNQSSTNTDGMYLNYNSTGTTNADLRMFANGTNERMRILASSGNVGIGTTTPDHLLEINGQLELQYDNVDGKIRFHDPGDYWYSMGIDRSDGGRFKINYGGNVGDAAHFSMQPNGNVGIGVTAANAKLEVLGTHSDVAGNHHMRVGTNFGFRVDASTGQNLVIEGNNSGAWSNAITINRVNGNVGMGLTAPGFRLELASASAAYPGGGTWANSSDRRLKKDIEVLNSKDALAKLLSLQGVEFDWINPDVHGGWEHEVGFVAQEVEKVFPNWVMETNPKGDDRKLLNSSERIKAIHFPHAFNAYLIEALREQQRLIENLKEADRQEELQSQLDQVKSENRQLKNEIEEIRRILNQVNYKQ